MTTLIETLFGIKSKKDFQKDYKKFKKDTQRTLWLLGNPERYKFGQKVTIDQNTLHSIIFIDDCIYKGQKRIEESEYDGNWTFERICFIEVGDSIMEFSEWYIRSNEKVS